MSTNYAHDGYWVGVDEAIGRFDDYLVGAKNASDATRDCYARHIRVFLETAADSRSSFDFGHVRASWVRTYVTDLGGRYAPQSLKLMATSLRCFLRFAWLSEWTQSDLSTAVGTVITHRAGRLPQALRADELQRLLAVPDRGSVVGSRDYAVLIVLSRLGLRSGEAARLRLNDFDWRRAQVSIRVKGGGRLRLPIPDDVGQAIVAYLRCRPAATPFREVFLRVRGTAEPLTREGISHLVARRAARAGLGTVHAHRLRHSAARAILDAGGNLTEVGELLGQQTSQVTMAYSSFDVASLKPLARCWPIRGGSHE